jgi:intracellular multiplication protein IcmJ
MLSVKRGLFRCDDPSADYSDSVFRAIRPKIIDRDNGTCKFCDFRSPKYQEVHHIDDNHANNDLENLITVCPLCHCCFHLGFTGQNNRGIIIYLDPTIGVSQADLNQVVRTLWIGELSKDTLLRMLSINMLAKLYKQNVPADRKLGSSDPLALGDFFLQMDDANYAKRMSFLNGYYLLPLKEGFQDQINYWSKNVFNSFSSENWISSTKDTISRWSENEQGDSSIESIFSLISK